MNRVTVSTQEISEAREIAARQTASIQISYIDVDKIIITFAQDHS